MISATAQAELRDDLAAAARPTAMVRRVAVAGLDSAVGVTTTVELLSATAATHRRGRVLAMATTVQAQSAILPHGAQAPNLLAEGLPEAVTEATELRGGVWIGSTHTDTRYFDVAIADWGSGRPAITHATAAATAAHVVAVVSSFDRDRADEAVAVLRALKALDYPVMPVLILNNLSRVRSTWPALVAPRLPFPTVVIDYDPALARGRDVSRASARTRRAGIRLAALVMRTEETGR